ncbi:MAG: M20/M25/M40 family metallo-hydrolase [Candidatus Dormibacteria bacterium]
MTAPGPASPSGEEWASWPQPAGATLAEVALLQELVRIPSESGHEGPAVDWLVDWLESRGVTARKDEVGNALAVVEPSRGAAVAGRIYLLGHIDTVGGHWEPVLEAGRLCGRGASDAKGPLAAFVAAALRARGSGRLRRPVHILGAVAEESTSLGARHLAGALPAPDFLIVGEPSGSSRLVVGYLGRLRCHGVFRCGIVHTSRPDPTAAELGVAAWLAIRSMVDELNRDASGFDAVHPHLLGFRSGSDGLSEHALVQLGFRLPPHVSSSQMLDRLRATAPGADWVVDACEEAAVVPRHGALPATFLRAMGPLGMSPTWQRRLATSDLNVVLPVWRCPAIVYGPGDASLDHTPEESIAIDDYGRAISVLATVLTEL